MAQEIEIKLRVESHDALRQRLGERGAAPLGRIIEINRIFDNRERTLLAGDCGLRVRECRDERGQVVRATLTYKGPKRAGPVKSREEIEVAVEDAASVAALLNALGFSEAVHFEKRRETWRLDECLVELDEVPYLGKFVEIEGPDEATIRRVQAEIGLAAAGLVNDSYIALLVEHCRANNLSIDSIRF